MEKSWNFISRPQWEPDTSLFLSLLSFLSHSASLRSVWNSALCFLLSSPVLHSVALWYLFFLALLFSLCCIRSNSPSLSCCTEKPTMISKQRSPGNRSRVMTMYRLWFSMQSNLGHWEPSVSQYHPAAGATSLREHTPPHHSCCSAV